MCVDRDAVAAELRRERALSANIGKVAVDDGLEFPLVGDLRGRGARQRAGCHAERQDGESDLALHLHLLVMDVPRTRLRSGPMRRIPHWRDAVDRTSAHMEAPSN